MRLPRRIAAALAVAALLLLLAPAMTVAIDPADQQTGYLQVGSNPPGAAVFVNQVRMNGVTPLTLRVPALQPQEVMVNLYGYEAERQTVTVQPNQTVPLMFELHTLPGVDRPETETPNAARSATAPPGGEGATQAIWEEETPVSIVAVLLALLGVSLLARRRR